MPDTVEINEAVFCTHFKEVCNECEYDGREENDGFFGFDPVERKGLEASAAANSDGGYSCTKHGSAACNQCFGWKKLIAQARQAK